jgi:hypothetical protein
MESAGGRNVTALRPEGNRLTVSLLLVWMFAIGLVLDWNQPWVIVQLPEPLALLGGVTRWEALRLVVAPLLGCGVGSILYWLVPGLRRHPFPAQPGHWLLMAFGFFWIGALAGPRWLPGQSAPVAGLIASIGTLLVGCCMPAMHIRWRVGLLMLGAALLWRCHLLASGLEGTRLDWVFNWHERELFLSLNWTSIVLLVGLAVSDSALKVHRDILHNAGIVVAIALLFVVSERYLGFLPWNW